MKRFVFMGDFLTEDRVLGVQRYGREIIRVLDGLLDEVSADAQIEVLVPTGRANGLDLRNIKVVEKGGWKSKWGRYLWQQLVFSGYVRKENAVGVDLAVGLPVFGRHIVAIHDCIHEEYPENFRGHRLFHCFYLLRVKMIARSGRKHIVTPSETSKRELMRRYAISDSRIDVVSNGWEHMLRIDADETIFTRIPQIVLGEYFFAIGSKYRHKNFQWILKAARKNPQAKFVISGAADLSDYAEALCGDAPDNVIFTGYITDREMKALMSGCRALIQPSLCEGFGIPPLEALSLGKDAVVADASCLPEIYGNSVRYIDPYGDGCDLNTLLEESVGGKESVLEKYTWKHAAQKLLEVMLKFDER